MQSQPKVTDRICKVLDSHGGEMLGTEKLADELSLISNKKFVIKTLRKMQALGLIIICKSCGGRGRMTVYKRNRNQPGIPRKVPR